MSSEQHKCYSASMDSTIRVWKLPESKIVPYGPVDPSLNLTTYIGHTDAIWDIRLFPIRQATQYLASASADGTVKIWDTEIVGSPLKCSWNYYGHNNGEMVNGDVPTSIDFVNTDLKKVVVAFQNSIIKLFDIETGQCVTTFKSNETSDNTPATQINRIISHPTLPLVFSAHEDKYIRFFDVNTGKCSFSMSAHLDSVTSLGVDPSGMVLISGGHDCSIRLWDIFSSRQCIQEFSSHRKKSDEGVLCVHYHPSLPWIASGDS
ncbi:1416_t:CDS:2 [Entrophospora sp. SA101]|nr:1416_t:CDS:2 [Entrophospora sp. SA101]CAJ0926998.1 14134_t:CDS:2 [Entrophospora sp. SA101]